MNVYLGPWSRTQRRRPRALGWLAFATLLFAAPLATAQSANKLDNIDVATLPGQQIQLTLHTTDLAPQPLAFTIDKPARLSIDLPGVGLALASRRVDVKSAGVDSVVSGEASGRSRVVVNLDAPAPYDVRVNGNTIVVTIGKVPAGATPGAGAQAGEPWPDGADELQVALGGGEVAQLGLQGKQGGAGVGGRAFELGPAVWPDGGLAQIARGGFPVGEGAP